MRNTHMYQASVVVNHVGQPNTQEAHRTTPKNGKKPTPYQKGDGNWYCTLNGKQYYLGTNPLRAQQKLDQILNGNVQKPIAGPTLGEVADLYLRGLENNQSPDTIRSKGFTYKSFVEFAGPNTPIASVTSDMIERFPRRSATASFWQPMTARMEWSCGFPTAPRKERGW